MNHFYTILSLIILTYSCSPCEKHKLYSSNVSNYSYNINESIWEVAKGAVGIEYFINSKQSPLRLKILSSKNDELGTPKILNKILNNYIDLEAPLSSIGTFESDNGIKYSKYKSNSFSSVINEQVNSFFYEFHTDTESFGFIFTSDNSELTIKDIELDNYMNCFLLETK